MTRSWPARLWSLLLGGLVGHGYRTWFAVLWLLGWLAAGTVILDAAHPGQFERTKPKGEALPAFQPAVYALDVLLPVVNLNQEAAWSPTGWVRWWVWAAILAGWVLTTAVVATLNEAIRAALRTPRILERVVHSGGEIPDLTPSQFREFLARDLALWVETARIGKVEIQ